MNTNIIEFLTPKIKKNLLFEKIINLIEIKIIFLKFSLSKNTLIESLQKINSFSRFTTYPFREEGKALKIKILYQEFKKNSIKFNIQEFKELEASLINTINSLLRTEKQNKRISLYYFLSLA
jgi:hypothetical protein